MVSYTAFVARQIPVLYLSSVFLHMASLVCILLVVRVRGSRATLARRRFVASSVSDGCRSQKAVPYRCVHCLGIGSLESASQFFIVVGRTDSVRRRFESQMCKCVYTVTCFEKFRVNGLKVKTKGGKILPIKRIKLKALLHAAIEIVEYVIIGDKMLSCDRK